MSRTPLTTVLCTVAAATLATGAAHARPIFMQYEGVDGECTSNSNMVETFVGGQRVVMWQTPSGPASLVFRPNAQNDDRPMEEVAFYYNKISASAAPAGASVGVADDVIVDGRIITAAVWAEWRKTSSGLELNFGKSREAAGRVEVRFKIGGMQAGPIVDCGWLPLVCGHLAAACPHVIGPCPTLCEGFCDASAQGRLEPTGGVSVNLPLGGLMTFVMPGGPAITADEVSVVLLPGTGESSMTLAAGRITVDGLPGLQINSARGEFACPADINNSGNLSVQDLFDFLSAYFAGLPVADFNKSGVLSVQDIFDYLAAYFRGC